MKHLIEGCPGPIAGKTSRYSSPTRAILLACLIFIINGVSSPAVQAQGMGPRPGQGMGGGPPEGKADAPVGPAEAAPEVEEGEPELAPLPDWPGQGNRRLQLFQMSGYFRFRWNMHHNLNLGMYGAGAPFYTPISESSALNCAARKSIPPPGGTLEDRDLDDDCHDNTLGGANMRLRLEPTINVRENVRIHTQLDIFDNLTLGSTPTGPSGDSRTADVPLDIFSDGQASPIAGANSAKPAIVVKRVWADVGILGDFLQLRFGRMPTQWGLGLLDNDGSCWNCNYGDSVDRIMVTAETDGFIFAMGYDFASSGPNSLGVTPWSTYYDGQGVDLEKLDDIHQLFWVLGRIDPEEVIRDKIEQGELVLNYGLYLLWRSQSFDYASTVGSGSSLDVLAGGFLERGAWTLTPDIWFKMIWDNLSIDFEGVLRAGRIENIADENVESPVDILQFGWVLRSRYHFLNRTLQVGLEIGMASGDQDESLDGDISRRRTHPLNYDTDGSLREFRFNNDYQVDLILFREILTTVSNAVYFKPSIRYDVIDTFGAKLDMIYSIAHEPVGFPGNSPHLGVEFDLDIFYHSPEEGFFAGLQYGLLLPLAALDRPTDIFGYSSITPYNAEIAQTLQARLIVKF